MSSHDMSSQLQREVSQYLGQGYQIEEQHSSTSVTLFKKRLFGLFGKRRLYLWVDGLSKVQISKQSFRDLTKKLSENVRSQRILQTKVSWTDECTRSRPWDEFDELLFKEYPQNLSMLTQLKKDKPALQSEISLRNFLGNMPATLKKEVERCLDNGYELRRYTNGSATLKRRVSMASSLDEYETLKLRADSTGGVQRDGESCATLQKRLDELIRLFKMNRKGYIPGALKYSLDKQFEFDAEVNALYNEMKYLGYTPNIGDYIL